MRREVGVTCSDTGVENRDPKGVEADRDAPCVGHVDADQVLLTRPVERIGGHKRSRLRHDVIGLRVLHRGELRQPTRRLHFAAWLDLHDPCSRRADPLDLPHTLLGERPSGLTWITPAELHHDAAARNSLRGARRRCNDLPHVRQARNGARLRATTRPHERANDGHNADEGEKATFCSQTYHFMLEQRVIQTPKSRPMIASWLANASAMLVLGQV